MINAYVKKEERFQINLTLHLKNFKEHTKPKSVRRKEVIEIREEINETNNRKTVGKKTTKWSCFLKRPLKLTNP